MNRKTAHSIFSYTQIILFSLLAFSGVANANEQQWGGNTERGWFWGERERWEEEQRKLKEEEAKAKEAEMAEQETPKEKDCKNPDEWDVTCGFVYPERDYDFSQLQLRELTKQLAMYPDDTHKVKQYQKFVGWAVDQAVTAAGSAEWNIIQDQEMNPFIDNPISAFGRRAAGMEIVKKNKSIYEDIVDQGGVLVFFSRHDCVYCHKAYPLYRVLSNSTGIPLYNASLDGKCLDDFEGEYCHVGENVELSAQELQVALVPDLFLFLPKDRGWIRISSGLEALDVVQSRISVFFGAAKRATQKGLERAAGSMQPAVDFSSKDIHERAKEAIGTAMGIERKLEISNDD